jgi:hypothetical protein
MCLDWKEAPNDPSTKYDKQGDTITPINVAAGVARGKVTKIVPGNAEKSLRSCSAALYYHHLYKNRVHSEGAPAATSSKRLVILVGRDQGRGHDKQPQLNLKLSRYERGSTHPQTPRGRQTQQASAGYGVWSYPPTHRPVT